MSSWLLLNPAMVVKQQVDQMDLHGGGRLDQLR